VIRFACPTCRKPLKVEDEGAGRKISCPRCGQRILVPSPDPPPSKPAAGNPTVLGALEEEAPPKPAAGNPTVLASWEDEPPPARGSASGATRADAEKPVATPISPPGRNGAPPVQEGAESDGPASPAKGTEEKFCLECGTVIRAKAEICPVCGVRQAGTRGRREEEPRFDGEPHRGTGILVLGVVSLFVMPLPLGLLAWFWGSEDLKKMNAGRMDPEGRGSTQAGQVCGMISVLLSLSAFCLVGLYFLGIFILFGTLFSGIKGAHGHLEVAPPAERRPTPEDPMEAKPPPAGYGGKEDARDRKPREEAGAAERDVEALKKRREALEESKAAEAEKKRQEDEKKRRAAEAKKAAADEEAAGDRLKYAKKLIDGGEADLARERLWKIVTEWPKTQAAAEAKKLLESIKPE
jgi:DNA-directed RNA polymerase subunit RPC12/RpoP